MLLVDCGVVCVCVFFYGVTVQLAETSTFILKHLEFIFFLNLKQNFKGSH
jgi:hypothetical protein